MSDVYLRLTDNPVHHTRPILSTADTVINVDYDAASDVIGVEVIGVEAIEVDGENLRGILSNRGFG